MYFTKTAFASGINDKSLINLGIYPNPSNNVITLNYFIQNSQFVNIKIIDLTGKSVFSEIKISESGFNDFTINTQHLVNGTYIVQLQGIECIVTQKFIVNK